MGEPTVYAEHEVPSSGCTYRKVLKAPFHGYELTSYRGLLSLLNLCKYYNR